MTGIVRIVETAIYVNDLDRAEHSYVDVLGLEKASREDDRHLFFRVGDAMLLLFNPRETIKGEVLPSHGTTGAGHFALGIETADLDAWRSRLQSHGVAIGQEVTWPRGGHSLYFRDPAGNAVELVTRGIWGLPDGW
jgi:catechol 2,3-dioxygenase-like lactoylglutathione lyase family enzyme